jgi:hypothetical protein
MAYLSCIEDQAIIRGWSLILLHFHLQLSLDAEPQYRVSTDYGALAGIEKVIVLSMIFEVKLSRQT